MREIKFRFWDEELRTMHSWEWAQGRTMTIFTWPNKSQFTGFRDEDEKEIYEGDFVKLPKGWMYPEMIGLVKWDSGRWMFSNGLVNWNLGPSLQGCRVVGNIYENPKLIET